VEIVWLEDFLAIVEHGSFSRAAEARAVTQPALSRRIRALEEWVGAPLFFRTTHRVQLSAAGESFRDTAAEVLTRLQVGCASAREKATAVAEELQFAATNALALTFFPKWFRSVEASLPFIANMHFIANHMMACEQLMLHGQAQFLLAHHHPAADTSLGPSQFLSHRVGMDLLIPISAPRRDADDPAFTLPGTEADPLPYLSYRAESGMGRIVAAVRRASPRQAWLKPTFQSHLAKLLVSMAIEGRGMAWLPQSLIADELASGALLRAGTGEWDIPIEIHLFRPRARLTSTAEIFWATAVANAKAKEDAG
jgi:DNA-binding transcriptional LysR family regulator